MPLHLYDNRFVLDEDVRFDGRRLSDILLTTKTYYVETTGSDTTGDGSVSKPFATIQKAVNVLPDHLTKDVTIYVGEGSFAGATIQKTADYAVRLVIKGTGINVIESEMSVANSSREYLQVTGKTWEIDEFKLNWVRATAGNGYLNLDYSSNLYPIVSNTANTIRVAPRSIAYDQTTKFEIVSHLSVLSSAIANYSSPSLIVYVVDINALGTALVSVNANTNARGVRFVSTGASQVGFSCTGAGSVNQCSGEGSFTFLSFTSPETVTVSQCHSFENTYAVTVNSPSGNLSVRGLFAEGFTYGINASRGATVNVVGTNDPCYFEGGGTVYWAATNATINATDPKTTITTNTLKAKAESGGKIFVNNDVTATTDYDISGNVTVVVNDDDGLVLTTKDIYQSKELADDTSIVLPTASSGFGEVLVDNGTEYVRFIWAADNTVTLSESTANIVSTDTDNKFCVFDNGSAVEIKNRLGSSKAIKLSAVY